MSAALTLKLDVWKGDWGLPSVDLDCLRFMAYIKFAGYKIEANPTSNPFFTPHGILPVVHLRNSKITTYEDLVNYFETKNLNVDLGLTNSEKAETEAFTNLLHEKLYPALQYVWWVDQKNCDGVIKPWYNKATPFPFNFYYPGKMAEKAKEMIAVLCENLESDKEIETKIYSDAEKCLTVLSVRLGESDYMFGKHPRSLDATVFAYLAPLLKAPLQSTTLQNHLKACTNLHKFVTRLQQKYFPNEHSEYEKKIKNEQAQSKLSKDTEFPNKTRNQLIAIVFASLAMFAYALHSGIVESEPTKAIHYLDDADPYESEKED